MSISRKTSLLVPILLSGSTPTLSIAGAITSAQYDLVSDYRFSLPLSLKITFFFNGSTNQNGVRYRTIAANDNNAYNIRRLASGLVAIAKTISGSDTAIVTSGNTASNSDLITAMHSAAGVVSIQVGSGAAVTGSGETLYPTQGYFSVQTAIQNLTVVQQ